MVSLQSVPVAGLKDLSMVARLSFMRISNPLRVVPLVALFSSWVSVAAPFQLLNLSESVIVSPYVGQEITL